MTQEDAGWHVENIKAELRKIHGTLREFARVCGVSPAVVSDAIANPNGSSRVELKIAEAIGVSPHKLWPERWTEDGRKIDRAEFRRAARAGRVPG